MWLQKLLKEAIGEQSQGDDDVIWEGLYNNKWIWQSIQSIALKAGEGKEPDSTWNFPGKESNLVIAGL